MNKLLKILTVDGLSLIQSFIYRSGQFIGIVILTKLFFIILGTFSIIISGI